MASVFKQTSDRMKKCASWIMKHKDADGRWRTKTGCSDKDASERIIRKLVADASLQRVGLIDPKAQRFAARNRRPLEEHVHVFETYSDRQGKHT